MNQLIELEKDLFEYTTICQYILIRCGSKYTIINYGKDASNTQYAKLLRNQNQNSEKYGFGLKYPHHTGIINDILISQRIQRLKQPSITEFELYFNELKHGLFHGIMSFFIVYLLKKNCGLNVENIQQDVTFIKDMVSIILHDFCKNHQEHDSYIKNYFPNLNNDIYTHSNPNFISDFIIADRCELMRFDDHESWIDKNKLIIPANIKQKIFFFYKYIRPNLEYLFEISNKPIISHGWENKLNMNPEMKSYPEFCYTQDAGSYCAFDTFFEDLPYGWGASKIIGIRPIIGMPSITVNRPIIRDHINIKMGDDPINNWIFLNKRKINENTNVSKIEKYLSQKDIYCLNIDICLRLLNLRRQFYSRLLTHSMPICN